MALPISEQLVRRVGGELHAGRWQYTRRQLYYAACAEAEVLPSNAAATGQAGLGAVCILLGLILLGVRPAGYVFLGAGVLLLLSGLTSRLRRPPVRGRLLALSYPDFCARFATVEPEGLLSGDSTPPETVNDSQVVVMCDNNETAVMVHANLATAGLAAFPVVQSGDSIATGATAVCVHDASPKGCAVAAELSERGFPVLDAGLRPRQLRADPDEQVLEGAPARLPRDLSAVLEETEIDWLRSGRRVELATRTPEQVMSLLHDAVTAITPDAEARNVTSSR
jgi:hypothetical protein